MKDIVYEDMYPIISKLNEIGCKFKIEKNQIYMQSSDNLKALDRLRTHPHPGFPKCNKSN